ncbi:DUF1592 domain-containing protein [Roseiconus nitratireducens]|nr:DUF1592 domain-containing protein [Roseiconus nitratireducens]
MTESDAVELVRQYCVDCHQGEGAEAGLDLAEFSSAAEVVDSIETWNKIADRIHEGQMPPEGSDAPTGDVRGAMVTWIRKTIHRAVCEDGISPGGPMLRRLNRTEYANTVRDLLGIHVNAGHALPVDGAGGEGFDNAAETLFISPIYAEKYLDAARSALGHALRDPGARNRIIVAEPDAERTPREAAAAVLNAFLPRAFRRPVDASEVDQYLDLFQSVYDQDQSFLPAIRFALEGAMVSPKFLFLWEEPNRSETPQPISQYELASRLSYFLWSSMPDQELMKLAAEGKLHQDDVLATQVARMLHSDVDRRGLRRDSKVRGFATSFIEQWLGTRALGREFKPDKSVAGRYDSELEGGMKYEPIFFFEDLLSENRSLLNLIDSDFTYVNRRLAGHYRVKGEFREQPKRVDLPEDSPRGGVLGMSAVLAVSSYAHRTSPVLRGKWILETLLGTPPPPPPPNVPELDEGGETAQPTSLRERLEQHRADPTCASCHNAMDPLGFGLENFDVLGRWRTEADGVPIDASGVLPGGATFAGPGELKSLLLQRKDQFIRHLTSKMLGYALARGLTNEDRCVAEAIAEKLAQDDYRAQTLVVEIVKSVPFRFKQGQNEQAVVGPVPAAVQDQDPTHEQLSE